MNKKYLGVLCIAFIGGLIGGILANKVPFLGEAFATSEKIIRANRFVLVDHRTGEPTAIWGLGDTENSSHLTFYSFASNKPDLALMIGNMFKKPGLRVFDRSGLESMTIVGGKGPSILLRNSQKEFAFLGLRRKSDEERLIFQITEGAKSNLIITARSMSLFDENRINRASLRISKSGDPALVVKDQTGKHKGILGIYESAGVLTLVDRKGKLKKN